MEVQIVDVLFFFIIEWSLRSLNLDLKTALPT